MNNDDKVLDLKEWLDSEVNDIKEEKEITTDESEEKELDNIESLLVRNNMPDELRLDEIEKEMYKNIYKMDKKAWETGEGYKSGFDMLDEKLNGIQPGLSIIGADSNVGKSSFLLNIGFHTALNDDVYTLYFSFDDDVTNLMPRIIAMQQKIPINAIRMPKSFEDYPAILKRRKKGIEDMYNMIDKFKIVDAESARTIETLNKIILKHMEYVEKNDKRLFVLIDSFHDVKTEDDFHDENAKLEYIADRLETYAKEYNIPIWCTSEMKKLNAYRRPINDDIRHSSRIKYEAKLILLLHNDVSQKGASEASVYYRNPDRPGKSPVIEVDFGKNKLSSFKGRLYYEFIPEYASIIECSDEDKERYDSLVHQSDD